MSKPKQYRAGDFVSSWTRDSKRHKWRLEFGYALLTNTDEDGFSVQTNETHVNGTSWTALGFDGYGAWERKLDDPIFDVKINKKSIKNELRTA